MFSDFLHAIAASPANPETDKLVKYLMKRVTLDANRSRLFVTSFLAQGNASVDLRHFRCLVDALAKNPDLRKIAASGDKTALQNLFVKTPDELATDSKKTQRKRAREEATSDMQYTKQFVAQVVDKFAEIEANYKCTQKQKIGFA